MPKRTISHRDDKTREDYRLLTVTDLQKTLNVSRCLAYEIARGHRLVNGQKLRSHRIGNLLRIPARELDRVLGDE